MKFSTIWGAATAATLSAALVAGSMLSANGAVGDPLNPQPNGSKGSFYLWSNSDISYQDGDPNRWYDYTEDVFGANSKTDAMAEFNPLPDRPITAGHAYPSDVKEFSGVYRFLAPKNVDAIKAGTNQWVAWATDSAAGPNGGTLAPSLTLSGLVEGPEGTLNEKISGGTFYYGIAYTYYNGVQVAGAVYREITIEPGTGRWKISPVVEEVAGSPSPSTSPSVEPSTSPSVEPSTSPSVEPSTSPSVEPSTSPSVEPSTSPSVEPSKSPTVAPSKSPTVAPSKSPTQKPSVPAVSLKVPYEVPGFHLVNGRWWYTTCEPYSQTIRCHTEIWSKQVVVMNGKYVVKQGWFFNNLTYLPFMTRAQWGSNPLAKAGQWTDMGRKYKTECDTAATGKDACRSYIWGTKVHATPTAPGKYTYKLVNAWVFNNIVRFKS